MTWEPEVNELKRRMNLAQQMGGERGIAEQKRRGKLTARERIDAFCDVNSFRELVDLFYQKREGMIHTYLYNNVKLVSFKEGEVVINAKIIENPHFTRTIAKLISKWTGRIWQVSLSSSNIGKSLYEEDLIEQQNEIDKMKTDKEVQSILKKFPGVTIHSI